MINKILIHGPASFRKPAILETDKNINLIYGLNGSGKSTLSEYMRNQDSPFYSRCCIEPILDEESEEILVYNESYVNEVFYSAETQKGIFSLSKENSNARKKIDEANTKLREVLSEINKQNELRKQFIEEWDATKLSFFNRFWQIKKQYAGGDRVLAYCLEGLKGSREALSNYIIELACPSAEPDYTIDQLRNEIKILKEFQGTLLNYLPFIEFSAIEVEADSIFGDVITGNANSRVAALIDKLHNSDWVKTGMGYETNGVCPFCQREYTNDIVSELKQYFNEDYERAIKYIKKREVIYELAIGNIPSVNFTQNPIIKELIPVWGLAIKSYLELLNSNLDKIHEKYLNPSCVIQLEDSSEQLKVVNDIIQQANTLIGDFNNKMGKISQELSSIKTKFWNKLRYDYNQSIQDYNNQRIAFETKRKEVEASIKQYKDQEKELGLFIEAEQKKIVNVEDAINHINTMLVDMGIVDFKIIKCKNEDGLYRIVRDDNHRSVFKTLSEGERTIISILYFIETCQGILDRKTVHKRRIIVIDDPVSSLSNMYIFNIGRLLRNLFYPVLTKDETQEYGFHVKTKFEQVFILTHSLYFFYEMTEMIEDKRHASQSLFRISKTEEGSKFDKMHYEHIQSDYHAYWMTIRDPETNPALIANCMRNIIEYFFNFVEKRDLNNVFNQDVFKHPKYQAFQRYINRESHSLGQNIYDFKEFNYEIFMDALEKVFTTMGYADHFKKMRKIK